MTHAAPGLQHEGQTEAESTMTVADLAARVGVDPSTAYRYLRAGELPGVRVGSHWAIDRARVDRFLAGQEDASGRPLYTAPAAPVPLALLPEPAHDDTAFALRWLQGAHAALALLLASAAVQAEAQGGQRVAG